MLDRAGALAWIVLGVAVLALRRPQPALVFEDGREWYLGAWLDPIGSFATPYAGYLHTIPRLVGLVERILPWQLAPTVGWLASLAVVALIAAFVASEAMPLSRNTRLALGGLVLLLPNVHHGLGSITFLHFYLAIFLVAAAVARGPFRWLLVALVLCGLSGPYGFLFLPLFVGRALHVRDRDSVARAVALGAPAIIPLLLALGARSTENAVLQPVLWVIITAGHLTTAVIGGFWTNALHFIGPHVPIVVGLMLVVLVIGSLRGVDWRAAAVAGYVVGVTLVSTMLFSTDPVEQLVNPLAVSRYFVPAAAVLGGLVIIQVERGNRAAVVVAALFIVGMIGDFRVPDWPAVPWDASCMGGDSPCVVRVAPGGQWDIQWPGAK